MGSNRLMQVALGKGQEDEQKAGLHQLSERLRGPVGLFFTSLPRDEARGETLPSVSCLLSHVHVCQFVLYVV